MPPWLRRWWTPGVRIRAILLMICIAAFAKFGIAEGTGEVALVAGLMLLVPWFLNSLVVLVRRHLYLPTLISGLLLAAVVIIAWNLIPGHYIYLSAGIGAAFFLLHALSQPWLKRRTGDPDR